MIVHGCVWRLSDVHMLVFAFRYMVLLVLFVNSQCGRPISSNLHMIFEFEENGCPHISPDLMMCLRCPSVLNIVSYVGGTPIVVRGYYENVLGVMLMFMRFFGFHYYGRTMMRVIMGLILTMLISMCLVALVMTTMMMSASSVLLRVLQLLCVV